MGPAHARFGEGDHVTRWGLGDEFVVLRVSGNGQRGQFECVHPDYLGRFVIGDREVAACANFRPVDTKTPH